MKITKSKLKEIIREMIEEEMNIPIWEQNLPEGWFQDLKAKAQKAYIKANPNSKYAKGVKSGEKEAPMTSKDKKAKRMDKLKKDRERLEKEIERKKERNKKNQEIVKQYKNIDWDDENDAGDLRNFVDSFRKMGKISTKDAGILNNELDEFEEEQMQDDPNFDKINFQQDKIRKLMTKAFQDKRKQDYGGGSSKSGDSSSRKGSSSSDTGGGFGSDVGATTRGLGGGIF
tara:strand:- start:52 stop:738 length:687 start_codon:yes stop_codon:yes gene_type:complete